MASVEHMTDEQFERYALEVLQRELGATVGPLSPAQPFQQRELHTGSNAMAEGS